MHRNIAGWACALCASLGWMGGAGAVEHAQAEGKGEQVEATAAPVESGAQALALGEDSEAAGDQSIAFGVFSRAGGLGSIAFGWNAMADMEGALAFGTDSAALGALSLAFGRGSVASDTGGIAFGGQAQALGRGGVAIGNEALAANPLNIAIGYQSSNNTLGGGVSIGAYSVTTHADTTAVGGWAKASGLGATAFGSGAFAEGFESTAIGVGSWAVRQGSALGAFSSAGDLSVAVGDMASATLVATAVGSMSQADISGTAVGNSSMALDLRTSAFGMHANAHNPRDSAFGAYSRATGASSTTLGAYSQAVVENSVAIGVGSYANRANTVSVGSAETFYANDGESFGPMQRQIVNVAAGTEANDVVIVAQLDEAIARLTGNLGDGLGSFQSSLDGLNGRVGALEAAFGTLPPQNAPPMGTGPGFALGPGSSAAADAVAIGPDSVAGEAGTLSVGSTGAERRVVHVADARAATDAVNLRQMQTAQAATLTEAKAYTDQRMQAMSDRFTDYDRRLEHQDTRIDRMGAMSAAMMSMSVNAAQSRSDRGRLAAGAGWHNGENALSLGYARNINDRISISLGGAFSSDESSAGIGFGIDL